MRTSFFGLLLVAVAVCAPLWASAAPHASQFADTTLALTGVCYATLGNSGPNAGSLITIDPLTGAGTLVGPTGITGGFGDKGVPALAIKSTGEMYALDIGSSSNLYRIDAFTGTATLIAATGVSSPPAAAFAGNDAMYVVDNLGVLYHLDDTTGAAAPIGPTGVVVRGLAFHPLTGVLWATNASGNVYTINPVTAAATLVGNTGQNPSPDLHFDAAGVLYAASGGGLVSNNLITIDTSTGVGTIVGPIGFPAVSGMASRLDRVTTGIASGTPDVPGLVLEQNYPNPFNPTTTISFTIDRPQHVSLSVYDAAGRRVRTLVDGAMPAGAHAELWDGRDRHGQPVVSGIYFYRLTGSEMTLTRKAILLK